MIDLLLTPAYAPFTIAFLVMIGVGLIEALGLGLGQVDLQPDIDADAGGFLDWLGVGDGLPILIWLTALLGCFTIVGLAIQQAATALFGAPLHWGLASGGALVLGATLNGFAAGALAKVIPAYESTVISADDLVMRRATILEGVARRGHPARARVTDQHRQAHYVMVEPHDAADHLSQGETCLLVRKDGAIFFATPDGDTMLRSI